jgi:uncharacterized damage-inducible protein DinB
MEEYKETTTTISQSELFIKVIVSNWELQNKRVNVLLADLTDEQLLAHVAPGRNRGIYLLGHLIAVNDGMLPLLGFGDKVFPELESLFIRHPDSESAVYPSIEILKNYWNEVNAALSIHFASIQPDEWLTRHTAVSEQDFAREPHRNKLNILANRTNHQSYHLGQLVFLK